MLYSQQKPLALYKKLVELFTKPGDWIFSGPTGIGMYYRNGRLALLCYILIALSLNNISKSDLLLI